MLDPQENSPHDIPDYDGIEDEAFPPLPPPHSPGRGGQEEGDPFADGDEGEVSQLADVPAAKRRGVKRPQPKLDSHRLVSDRGLPALGTLFDNIQFKGKGHEAADLRLLMQKMENWAHRLYPKLQFEDFIDKVERLGSKKEVQTCLKRIRLDMPLTHEDFTSTDGPSDSQTADMLGDEPPAASSPNVINGSTDGDETVEDPDLEPTNNTSTQQTSALPPKDSEPAEEESGLSPEQQLSTDCVGGD